MRPLLEAKDETLHEAVFSEHGYRIMIRTRAWKLIFYAGKPYGELYDLVEDPDELHNLYDVEAYRDIRQELEEQLLDWYAETRFRRSDLAHHG